MSIYILRLHEKKLNLKEQAGIALKQNSGDIAQPQGTQEHYTVEILYVYVEMTFTLSHDISMEEVK